MSHNADNNNDAGEARPENSRTINDITSNGAAVNQKARGNEVKVCTL